LISLKLFDGGKFQPTVDFPLPVGPITLYGQKKDLSWNFGKRVSKRTRWSLPVPH
jgi:hypothetical protein